MGSVPHLYTAGDNDPEFWRDPEGPVQYYRHYLYCDACGSFDFGSWVAPENHEALEKARRRLATAAVYSSPLVLVSGWLALGFALPLSFWVYLAAGIALALILLGCIWKAPWAVGQPMAALWRFFKRALLWLLIVVVLEWPADLATVLVSPWLLLLAGLLVIVGLLVAREVLGSKIELVGMRCGQCDATYAHGTPFFTDLDANPRHLTVAEVPRPLGVSPFLRGKSVDDEPPEAPSGLPA